MLSSASVQGVDVGRGTEIEVAASTGIAGSAAARGQDAAGRAVTRAIEDCGEVPGLVLAFSSGIDPRPAAGEIAEAAGDARGVGLTGKGALGPDGIVEEGCAAIAFGSRVRTGVAARPSPPGELRASAAEASVEALRPLAGERNVLLLLLLDTPRSDQAEAVAGAYEVAGPDVPIAGGGAGGPETAVLDGEPRHDAVLAVALAAPNGIGLGAADGCITVAEPAQVTGSEGLVVTELDGRPAGELYLERHGQHGGLLDDDDFEAFAVTHPLAQAGPAGERRLRHIRWREGTVLACATHLPVGTEVGFTHQAPADIIAASSRAVEDSLGSLGRPPGAALVFDCAGRKRAIGGGLGLESSALYAAFDSVPPIAGAFTYGEVGRHIGAEGDLNHAIVVATLA
jgi:hypothetical protein